MPAGNDCRFLVHAFLALAMNHANTFVADFPHAGRRRSVWEGLPFISTPATVLPDSLTPEPSAIALNTTDYKSLDTPVKQLIHLPLARAP